MPSTSSVDDLTGAATGGTLSVGASGEHVTQLQPVLDYHHGCAPHALLQVDGILGPLTQHGVEG